METQVKGEGPLVIFVNNGLYGQWMWDDITKALYDQVNGSIKTITYDYNGFGKTPGMFKDIHQECTRLRQLIEKEKEGQRVCLVGHGIGAQIAIKVSDSVDQVIAISALNEFSPLQMKSALSSAKQKKLLNRINWYAKRSAESQGIPSKHLENYCEDSRKLSSGWLTNMIVANMTFESEQVDSSKVMVVVGEGESKQMLTSACKLSNQPVIIKGASHDIPFKCSEEVAKWILKALKLECE